MNLRTLGATYTWESLTLIKDGYNFWCQFLPSQRFPDITLQHGCIALFVNTSSEWVIDDALLELSFTE